jgi:Flp pilus assembly pilin Flp
MRDISGLCNGEDSQDLIEYLLLLAFIALVAALLLIQAGAVTAGIWGTTNKVLTSAAS